jgi:hypothetical protein
LQSVFDAYFKKTGIGVQDNSEKITYVLSVLKSTIQQKNDDLFTEECKKNITSQMLTVVESKINLLLRMLPDVPNIKNLLQFYSDKITDTTVFFERNKDLGFTINFRKGLSANISLHCFDAPDFSCAIQLIETNESRDTDIVQSTFEIYTHKGNIVWNDFQSFAYQNAKRYLTNIIRNNDLRNDIVPSQSLSEQQKEIFLDYCIYSLMTLPKVTGNADIKTQAKVLQQVLHRFDRDIVKEKNTYYVPDYPFLEDVLEQEHAVSEQIFLSTFHNFFA